MNSLDALLKHMKALSAPQRMALAASCGLDPEVGRAANHRAQYHHGINANAFLGLCSAAGIDPMTGGRYPVHPRIFEIYWPSLGAAFMAKRKPFPLRAAAEVIGVSIFTLSRLENGRSLSVESFLAVAKFVNVSPVHYAHVRDVPRETTPNKTLENARAA